MQVTRDTQKATKTPDYPADSPLYWLWQISMVGKEEEGLIL